MTSAKTESIIENLKISYQSALNQTDPRTRDYLLVWNDPTAAFSLVAGYILFVLLGKRIMQNFNPVHVSPHILFVYNFGLVLLSLYMFEEIIAGVIQSNYNWSCGELKYTKAEMRLTNALWWYFFSKAIEFLDTFWMVIRKNFRQITFLHVFHHSSMLVIWWFVISFAPGGQAFFGAALNCLVHVVMYLYYSLAVYPSLKKYLWWKKYITQFQLIQFVITLTQTLIGLYKTYTGQCNFPYWPQILLTVYMFMMLGLFSNFYLHEYIKKSNEKKMRLAERDSNNNLVNGKDSNGKVKKSN
jgi:hypothetical protein